MPFVSDHRQHFDHRVSQPAWSLTLLNKNTEIYIDCSEAFIYFSVFLKKECLCMLACIHILSQTSAWRTGVDRAIVVIFGIGEMHLHHKWEDWGWFCSLWWINKLPSKSMPRWWIARVLHICFNCFSLTGPALHVQRAHFRCTALYISAIWPKATRVIGSNLDLIPSYASLQIISGSRLHLTFHIGNHGNDTY